MPYIYTCIGPHTVKGELDMSFLKMCVFMRNICMLKYQVSISTGSTVMTIRPLTLKDDLILDMPPLNM